MANGTSRTPSPTKKTPFSAIQVAKKKNVLPIIPLSPSREADDGESVGALVLNTTGVPLATTAELTLEALVVSSQRMSGEFLPSFEAGQKKVGTAVSKHLPIKK